jgi:hypothetical protein
MVAVLKVLLRLKLVLAIRGLAGAAWKPPPLKPRADALVGTSAVVARALAAMSIKIEERCNMVGLHLLRLHRPSFELACANSPVDDHDETLCGRSAEQCDGCHEKSD